MKSYLKLKDGFHGERSFVLPGATTLQLAKHPLSAVLHITDIGYYPHASHHYRERKNPIDQYVLIYCVEGKGWYEIDGVRHTVDSDTFFILPEGVAHRYGSDESHPWTIYWVHFRGSLAPYYASDLRGTVKIKPGLRSRIFERNLIFEEIMSILGNGTDFENLLFACSVFHHFLGSLRYAVTSHAVRESSQASADVANAAIIFMKENIEKRLKIKDIAGFVGYSPSQFSSIFQRSTGMSPIVYFNMLKIRHACDLLTETGMMINQISYKVGITDPLYFSRLFTQVMGVSPSVYRKQTGG